MREKKFKWVDFVYENEKSYIGLVATLYNYYIGCFDKKYIEAEIEFHKEIGEIISVEEIIESISVYDLRYMTHLCRYEDYTDEMLWEYINRVEEFSKYDNELPKTELSTE